MLEDVGTKTLKYLYDFGDDWEHTIKVERLIAPELGVLYPRLIEAKGHCPPEDLVVLGAMARSSRPSPIPATSGIANSRNGSRTISIPMLSTSIGCPKMLPNWLNAGRANPLSSAAVPPNPRCSTDGHSRASCSGIEKAERTNYCHSKGASGRDETGRSLSIFRLMFERIKQFIARRIACLFQQFCQTIR